MINNLSDKEKKEILNLHLIKEDDQNKTKVIGFFDRLKNGFKTILSKLKNNDNQNKGFEGLQNDLERLKYMTENIESIILVLNSKYKKTMSKEGIDSYKMIDTYNNIKKINQYTPIKNSNTKKTEDEFRGRV